MIESTSLTFIAIASSMQVLARIFFEVMRELAIIIPVTSASQMELADVFE